MSLGATLGSRRSIAWRPVTYNKVPQRIEISATTNEAVAQALENAKDLPKEVSSVTVGAYRPPLTEHPRRYGSEQGRLNNHDSPKTRS